jgi:hypothetical protein
LKGEYSIVFGTPEALLNNEQWRSMLKSDVYQNSLIALVTDEAHVIPKWLVQNFITGITLCLVSKLLCYSTYLATYIAFNIRTPPVEKSTGCPLSYAGNPVGGGQNSLIYTGNSSGWGVKTCLFIGCGIPQGYEKFSAEKCLVNMQLSRVLNRVLYCRINYRYMLCLSFLGVMLLGVRRNLSLLSVNALQDLES